jgi:hypothetical protein
MRELRRDILANYRGRNSNYRDVKKRINMKLMVALPEV